jgi:hypothetical protein
MNQEVAKGTKREIFPNNFFVCFAASWFKLLILLQGQSRARRLPVKESNRGTPDPSNHLPHQPALNWIHISSSQFHRSQPQKTPRRRDTGTLGYLGSRTTLGMMMVVMTPMVVMRGLSDMRILRAEADRFDAAVGGEIIEQ